KDQRRIVGKLTLDGFERRPVRIIRDLNDRFLAPAVARPTLGHGPSLRNVIARTGLIAAGVAKYQRVRKPRQCPLTCWPERRYSAAASRTWLWLLVRIVTSSSAAVGWTAMVASKSAL